MKFNEKSTYSMVNTTEGESVIRVYHREGKIITVGMKEECLVKVHSKFSCRTTDLIKCEFILIRKNNEGLTEVIMGFLSYQPL